MSKNKTEKHQPASESEKEHKTEVAKNLRQASQDPAAKEAQKKEKQPRVPDDLSPLLNTHEVGTSGGDQRATKTEAKNQSK